MPEERELRKSPSAKGALLAPGTKLVPSYDLVAFVASRCRSSVNKGLHKIRFLVSGARNAFTRAVFCCATPSPPLTLWDLVPAIG
jgi:hypothetical protein